MTLTPHTKHLPLSDIWVDVPTVADFTSGDNYAEVGVWPVEYYSTKVLSFSCITHNVKVEILGSLDGGVTFPNTVESEFTLTASAAPTVKTITKPWTHLQIQAKSATSGAGNTGVLTVQGFGSTALNIDPLIS